MVVYHYCNTFNALAILKERRIRLTDVYRMNDAKEARYLYTLYLEEFNKYAKDPKVEEFYDFAMSHNHHFYTKYLQPSKGRFACCFSVEVDLTSQWIAYGDNGHGYALGFEDDFFQELNDSFYYQQVEYYSPYMIEEHVKLLYKKYKDKIEENPRSTELLETFLLDVKVHNIDACLIKSFHFKSEQEKRLVYEENVLPYQSTHFRIKNRDYYAKNNCITTYFGLYFHPHLLKEVIIGPKNRNEIEDIKALLADLGYNNVKVIKSNSGYI